MPVRIVALLALVATLVSGCSNMKAEDFAEREPKLVIEDYFLGRTKAWGIFQDRFGTLRRQFEVTIEGSIEGETLVLVEDFLYDDGEEEQRIWRIDRTGPHRYEGRADDVVGVAKGEAYGNALNWTYRFNLKVGDSTWEVTFDDWLFLQSDGVLINRAAVTKFGILLGEVTLFFQKQRHSAAEDSPLRLAAAE